VEASTTGFDNMSLMKVAAISRGRAAAIAITMHLPIHSVAHVTGRNIGHRREFIGADLWSIQQWHCIGPNTSSCLRANANCCHKGKPSESHSHDLASFPRNEYST